MSIRVEHELHRRRRGRNVGLGLILVSFVAIIFGLTVVKVTTMRDIHQMGAPDPLSQPEVMGGG